MSPRVLVVGAGITGLTAALHLLDRGCQVVVRESDSRLGGKILSSPFAGVDGVDEGPDAFLRRVPEALGLAERLGLGGDLVAPEPARAAVWHHGLHDLPDGLVLGVPGDLRPMVTTGLLSWRGKARAATEPLRPRTSTEPDAIGPFVRARFGDEVHERLVDALIGSIYAWDTDRTSLHAVPQLRALVETHRSLLVAARRARSKAPTPTGGEPPPIFAAPRRGMGSLVDACVAAIATIGGELRLDSRVEEVAADGAAWRVDDEPFDAVAVAAPAAHAATILSGAAPEAAGAMATIETADVILATLALDSAGWPDRLRERSGYLVPKPVQGRVTAVSFGSQKWGHWRPSDGSEILRVSLGRDGAPVRDLSDDDVIAAVVDEVGDHLSIDLAPTDVRISRWPAAFPQYRPHHHELVGRIDDALPERLAVGGASYRGIGIPACVRDGAAMAARLAAALGVAGSTP